MVTRWTQGLLDEVNMLLLEKKYRSALQKLLIIFDVYPDLPQAQILASALIRSGSTRTTDASADETLEPRHLFDSRLDPIFCACEAPGCAVSWVSGHHLMGDATAAVSNPLGAQCRACGVTLCRRHLPAADRYGMVHGCPQCGRELNPAPPPNGRQKTNQTPRLNKRLVDVVVLVEGKRPPSPEFMTGLCTHVIPDVFDDDPRIKGYHEKRFRGDGSEMAWFLAADLSDAYTTDAYDMRVYPGQQAGRHGQLWVIVKIFENRPKHVDPDNPATSEFAT
ncbi:hypothetical protein [Actinopolymorpha alba]|uniref:hypothetical protein n=1 Tax=Actinopolymorpha alba TaxID=533267 RepID=UPI00035FFB19|nr:hypothetical protein [Actinopolymorpha alba]